LFLVHQFSPSTIIPTETHHHHHDHDHHHHHYHHQYRINLISGKIFFPILVFHVLYYNKSAKLAQNKPVIFVVNSMVMTTFLEAGYSTWSADTPNSVFGQFKGHYSEVPGGIWQVIELG